MSIPQQKRSNALDPRYLPRRLWHILLGKLDDEWFEFMQRHGLHTKRVHYYSPIPDTRTLTEEFFRRRSELPGIDMRDEAQLALLGDLSAYRGELEALASGGTKAALEFSFENTFYTALDAVLLYSMIRRHRPRRVIEIGSGFSTRITSAALRRNAADGAPNAVFIAIEPFPDKDRGVIGATQVIERPVQEVDLATFQTLEVGDVLFIDSSHVAKQGSDVCFEFLEVLPRLNRGVIVHVHDIFFPYEYPREWVVERHAFWNEQYLLQAFLSGNRDFQVLAASQWLLARHPAAVKRAFGALSERPRFQPGAFWMQKLN